VRGPVLLRALLRLAVRRREPVIHYRVGVAPDPGAVRILLWELIL
jgi:hypothetical protein